MFPGNAGTIALLKELREVAFCAFKTPESFDACVLPCTLRRILRRECRPLFHALRRTVA